MQETELDNLLREMDRLTGYFEHLIERLRESEPGAYSSELRRQAEEHARRASAGNVDENFYGEDSDAA